MAFLCAAVMLAGQKPLLCLAAAGKEVSAETAPEAVLETVPETEPEIGPGEHVGAETELYLAGASDAWPFEFYDRSEKTYRGIIPDLLKTAADSAGISLKYIQTSEDDERLALAENIQVDAICTAGFSDEEYEGLGLDTGKELLSYEDGGSVRHIYLAYTKSMDSTVRERLEDALSAISEQEIESRYLFYANEADADRNRPFSGSVVWWVIFGAAVLSLLVVMPLLLYRERRRAAELAFLDNITGRENFNKWLERFSREIVSENRQHYCVVYLYTGVDTINHIYGYEEAQDAVKQIADVCQKEIDGSEAFARIHDFHFVCYLRYGSVEKLKQRVWDWLGDITRAFEDKRYFLDLHTGVYRLGNLDTDPRKTVQYSQIAVEYARIHETECAVYDEFLEQETIYGYALEHEAIHGLMHNEFIMYVQPLIELKTGRICGGEALVRWLNPTRGLMHPEAFLDVMKKKQLTGKMNMEIFGQGCRFLKAQSDKGRKLKLMFNFTVDNIKDEKFASQIYRMVQRYGVRPDQIMIQLNQLVEMSRAEQFMDSLRRLRGYGFDVFLSGLELDRVFFQYLDCNVNGLKLRPELVHNVDSTEGHTIMETVVRLCKKLGLTILCVGVEKEPQVEILRQLECEMASGYYYYYPMSEEAFAGVLEEKDGKNLNEIDDAR
ncbi:EAL domain-containing protein [Blautia schinkii]|nr:EAL domain-containing protein [Blautia schinkii]